MNKERILAGLKPEEVFYYFEEITKIPHGSRNEKGISDYIVNLARKSNLNAVQDDFYNVVVNIPATEGYENKKKTIIQAHIDRVCAKDETSSHNFSSDPLDIYVDGEYVKARNTTLGADDGTGVAMMLAIMSAKDLNHPPLQMLFTAGEEIRFVGASAMDEKLIDGEQLIGLDCSDSNVIMVSCAGFSSSKIKLPTGRERLETTASKTVYKMKVEGLASGHSGNMIHLGRVNAIKLMGAILLELAETVQYDLISFISNGLENVISKTADAVICCDTSEAEKLEEVFNQLGTNVKKAYRRTEPEMKISLDKVSFNQEIEIINKKAKNNLLTLLEFLPYGANTMIDDDFSLAESSLNIGSLIEIDGRLEVELSIRSNNEYQHDVLLRKCRDIAAITNAQVFLQGRSVPWEYNPNSSLLRIARELYHNLNGKAPVIKMIHASVEATVFIDKMKKKGKTLDIINIGCDQLDVHTTSERLKISSVEKVYRLLRAVLEASD